MAEATAAVKATQCGVDLGLHGVIAARCMQRPLTPDEVLAAPGAGAGAAYGAGERTVVLGDGWSLCFENRHSVLATLRAVVAVEGVSCPDAIAAECAAYDALLAPGQVSALLAVQAPAPVAAFLQGYAHLPQTLSLRAGPRRAMARFRGPVSMRQHVSFAIDPPLAAALADPAQPGCIYFQAHEQACRLPIGAALRRLLREVAA